MWETWVRSLGWEDPLATHTSILAWRIPMDRGAWQVTVHGVAESDMTERLSTAASLVVRTPGFYWIHPLVEELRSHIVSFLSWIFLMVYFVSSIHNKASSRVVVCFQF